MLAALECAQPMSEMRGVGGGGGKKAPPKFVLDVAGFRSASKTSCSNSRINHDVVVDWRPIRL